MQDMAEVEVEDRGLPWYNLPYLLLGLLFAKSNLQQVLYERRVGFDADADENCVSPCRPADLRLSCRFRAPAADISVEGTSQKVSNRGAFCVRRTSRRGLPVLDRRPKPAMPVRVPGWGFKLVSWRTAYRKRNLPTDLLRHNGIVGLSQVSRAGPDPLAKACIACGEAVVIN